jgi:two-component system response regulator FixJ
MTQDSPPAAPQPPRSCVHLVDDDAAVRQGVAMLLRAARLRVVTYDSAVAFLAALDTLDPSAPACVLSDVRMPEIDGIELVERLRAAGNTLPVVMMTAHGDVLTAVRAMKAGANDFIEKPFEDTVLLAAIENVLAAASAAAAPAESALPDTFAAAACRVAQLSRREREVLDLLVAGRSNKVVAHELSLSERTVEVHRARMLERLGVRTLPEAVRLAVWAELAGGVPQAEEPRQEPPGGPA